MKYLLAIDLETTGLDPHYNEITQIGAILLDAELKPIANFKSLVSIMYPQRGIRENFNVFEFTGISLDDLDSAPPLVKVLEKFLRFVKKNTELGQKELREVTLLGQNTKFDINFLEAAFDQCNLYFPFDYHNIDLATAYTIYFINKFGKLPEKIGLKAICDHFESEQLEAHDAMNDITMTVAMFKQILKELKND